jgi:glycosyltransferase involved in cell wall biosynthesis
MAACSRALRTWLIRSPPYGDVNERCRCGLLPRRIRAPFCFPPILEGWPVDAPWIRGAPLPMTRYSVAVVAACPFPYPRGTPIRILRMAESLSARGHYVEVITYHLGQTITDPAFPIRRIPRLPTYRRLRPGPSYQKLLVVDLLLAGKVFSVLRSRHFDLIHAHHYEGLLASLPAARLLRLPLVFDVHTLLSSELPHYSLGLPRAALALMGHLLDRLLPPRADHIVAVTNSIRGRLTREVGIPGSRVTTVYTAAESAHLGRASTPDHEAAARTLIYTGTLEAYQGIDLMLRAFRRVVDHRPDTRLKIVTDAQLGLYAKLIQQLQLQSKVDLVSAGYFDLPQHLHSALIALSPRVVSDGLPTKVLNYMAAGRAIVAFSGSAEILENGTTGIVVPDNDTEAFAGAVLDLLADRGRAEKLGRNARAHVREFFVWEAAVQRLEQIYAEVLQERPS